MMTSLDINYGCNSTSKFSRIKSIAENYINVLRYDENKNIYIVMLSIAGKNWGDALNLPLVQHISGKRPVVFYRGKSSKYMNFYKKGQPIYCVIGSILNSVSNDKNLIIWGSGFINNQGKLHHEPLKICAVRGPLTRDLILESGYDCPKIYGDPALLYPLIYNPQVEKKYKIGIIPHFKDQNNILLKKFMNHPDVMIIDILADTNKVVDNICSCHFIASSSLHGIIASDAYGIPSTWIELSKNVPGDGFKFKDYYASVNRKDDEPFVIKEDTTVQDITEIVEPFKLELDLNVLLSSCPFKKENFNFKV